MAGVEQRAELRMCAKTKFILANQRLKFHLEETIPELKRLQLRWFVKLVCSECGHITIPSSKMVERFWKNHHQRHHVCRVCPCGKISNTYDSISTHHGNVSGWFVVDRAGYKNLLETESITPDWQSFYKSILPSTNPYISTETIQLVLNNGAEWLTPFDNPTMANFPPITAYETYAMGPVYYLSIATELSVSIGSRCKVDRSNSRQTRNLH